MGGINSINSLEPVGNCMGMQNNKQEEEKRNNTGLSFADMLYQNTRLNHKKPSSEKEEEKEQEPKEPAHIDLSLSYMMMNNYISSTKKKDEKK